MNKEFEADVLAAFPEDADLLSKRDDGSYFYGTTDQLFAIWIQQAKRYEHSGGCCKEFPPTGRQKSFSEAAMPLIKWLCENMNPHCTVIVTPTCAELLEGVAATGEVLDYLAD